MKIAGVVCEYNPFHNGHAYHLNAVRQAGATHIVAAMSGNFVQRGTPAFCSKLARARAAVRCGADLVLELPVPFCCGSAGVFARGAVETLISFGVDLLSFGAECDDLELLQTAAAAGLDSAVQAQIKALHAQGVGYPAAAQQAVAAFAGDAVAAVLAQPNNTLAVEYIKAAKTAESAVSFLPVKRVGAAHDAATSAGGFAPATLLRAMQTPEERRPYMPAAAFEEIFADETRFLDETAFETAVLCALRMLTKADMERFVADGSGLAMRVFTASRQARSLEELYALAQTKSLTAAKVRRATLGCFLQTDKTWQKKPVPYLRALAANKRGLELLSHAQPKLPLITKHSETAALHEEARAFYALQCRANDLYAAVCSPKGAAGEEQRSSMLILSA